MHGTYEVITIYFVECNLQFKGKNGIFNLKKNTLIKIKIKIRDKNFDMLYDSVEVFIVFILFLLYSCLFF